MPWLQNWLLKCLQKRRPERPRRLRITIAIIHQGSSPHRDHRHHLRVYYCEGCQKSRTSLDSDSSTVLSNKFYSINFNDFETRVFAQFHELNSNLERISNRISYIEESISDHHAIINELEREISLIANKLDKLSYLHNKPFVSVPSSAELNSNYILSSPKHIYTSFPRLDSPAPSRQPLSPSSRNHPTPFRPSAPLHPSPSRPHPPPSPSSSPSRPLPDLILLPVTSPFLPLLPTSSSPLPTSRPHPPSSRPHPPLPDLILLLPDLILPPPVLNLSPPDLMPRPHPSQTSSSSFPTSSSARPVLFILQSVALILPHPVLSPPSRRSSFIYISFTSTHRDLIPLCLVPIHPALFALHHISRDRQPLRPSPPPHTLSANSFPPLPRYHPSPNITSSGPNNTSSSARKTLLVLGDSNTKYIRFPNTRHHRIPTYTIEEIDPSVCIGYAKIWIHVGINNLKSVRCGGPDDVHKSFELFMHKIERIGRLSPNTTVIISPILPTGVNILNERAGIFNQLLFSTKRWWLELDFSTFANRFGMLDKYFRCFGNPKDKIHLGANGIRELEHLIANRIPLVDARSYSAVVQSSST